MNNNIIITVQGHHHSKKSYLITLLKRFLESQNVNVHVQDFALKNKIECTDEQILNKLKDSNIFILEQDT